MGAIVGEYTRRAASGAPIRPPQDDLNCPYYLTGRCAAFQGAGECARKDRQKIAELTTASQSNPQTDSAKSLIS
jgi:hypothetical protein